MERKYYKIYIIIIIYDTSFDLLLFHELFFLFKFHPSKVAAKAITLSIRQQFDHPWPTLGATPKDHQVVFPSVFVVSCFSCSPQFSLTEEHFCYNISQTNEYNLLAIWFTERLVNKTNSY